MSGAVQLGVRKLGLHGVAAREPERSRGVEASAVLFTGESRVAGSRPKGVLALGWACLDAAMNRRAEHRPTAADYPQSVIRRVDFAAGGGLGWRISALITPRPRPTAWKIVVVTGSPSWAEYWAPVLAALPPDREMIVVDRPGFAASQPTDCVPDLRAQARALAPLLRTSGRQRLLLVGQSYGAAIATLMAAAQPRRIASLALLSSYLGQAGPTARWLVGAGSRVLTLIPRDLRNAVMEVSGHAAQMPLMREAIAKVSAPIHLIHGEADDFAPIEAARSFALATPARRPIRFRSVPGANHFLNDGPPETLLGVLEECLPARGPAIGAEGWKLDSLTRLFRPGLSPVAAGS